MLASVVRVVRTNRLVIAVFLAIFVIFCVNSVHNSYPDEFDNILGGYLINHGSLPYSGFFSHHGPAAYFLASFLTLLSGQSFVWFRALTTLFYLAVALAGYLVIRLRTKFDPGFFLFFWLVIAVSATYFWAHMFLADPLSGYFLVPPFTLLVLKMYRREPLAKVDLILISLFTFLAVLISLTFIYLVGVLVFFTFIYYFSWPKAKALKRWLRELLWFILIFALPYLLFLLYLLVTRSLSDYFFQAIIYNKDYYIYNYPRPQGSSAFNPIRYAVVIVNKFIDNYVPLLTQVRNVDLADPFNLTLALGNVFFWTFLLLKRHFRIFLLSLLVIIFSTVRNDPIAIRATDYQSAVYIMLSLLQGSLLIFLLFSDLRENSPYIHKVILSPIAVVYLFLFFFSLLYVGRQLWGMSYDRFMGTMPLIYDRPQVAPLVNAVLSPNDYCWVGPFYFEEMFYLKCRLPSKYDWILPQFEKSTKIQTEMVGDYEKHKPAIIVFNRNFFAFGFSPDYSRFFTDYLDENFYRLKDIRPEKHYSFKLAVTQDFDLNRDFHFEKSRAESLVDKFVSLGYIISSPAAFPRK